VFGEELKTTFNMKHKDNPGYATAAVDMMFISPDIKVSEKACPEVDVSDHLPLVVQLLV
jgi:endonuclease/exonuclease/phosphatase family metal-dependent hydrolase